MPTPRLRRWFQFGLRTMFVVVTVLAIPLVWLRLELKFIHRRNAFLETLELQILDRDRKNGSALMRVHGDAMLTTIPWWRQCLGDKPQSWLAVPADTPSEDVEELFPELAHGLR